LRKHNFLKLGLVLLLPILASNLLAVELLCKGEQSRMQNQRPYLVDCSNRKEVIDALGGAWRSLRNERIGGATEDLCWRPFQQAQDLHPSIQMNGIAQTFFAQCNMALQYVK